MIYFRDGKMQEGELSLAPMQPAFRTGYGFYETIAWNRRTVCHLNLHLVRVMASLEEFCITPDEVDYEKVLPEVVAANGLSDSFARINLFYPLENGRARTIVTADPFDYQPERVWKMRIREEIFLSEMMRHKTMSHMEYFIAWQQAVAEGADDSVFCDPAGNILESSVSALVFARDGHFYETDTNYKLPSTALAVAAQHLKIERKVIPLSAAADYEHVYALNSLVGMIPVSELGEYSYKLDFGTAAKVTRLILS
jgi:4-amino-4-deoxychorismate lyase